MNPIRNTDHFMRWGFRGLRGDLEQVSRPDSWWWKFGREVGVYFRLGVIPKEVAEEPEEDYGEYCHDDVVYDRAVDAELFRLGMTDF